MKGSLGQQILETIGAVFGDFQNQLMTHWADFLSDPNGWILANSLAIMAFTILFFAGATIILIYRSMWKDEKDDAKRWEKSFGSQEKTTRNLRSENKGLEKDNAFLRTDLDTSNAKLKELQDTEAKKTKRLTIAVEDVLGTPKERREELEAILNEILSGAGIATQEGDDAPTEVGETDLFQKVKGLLDSMDLRLEVSHKDSPHTLEQVMAELERIREAMGEDSEELTDEILAGLKSMLRSELPADPKETIAPIVQDISEQLSEIKALSEVRVEKEGAILPANEQVATWISDLNDAINPLGKTAFLLNPRINREALDRLIAENFADLATEEICASPYSPSNRKIKALMVGDECLGLSEGEFRADNNASISWDYEKGRYAGKVGKVVHISGLVVTLEFPGSKKWRYPLRAFQR